MSVIEEIRTKADIIDIVSGYISINQSGKYFKSVCLIPIVSSVR